MEVKKEIHGLVSDSNSTYPSSPKADLTIELHVIFESKDLKELKGGVNKLNVKSKSKVTKKTSGVVRRGRPIRATKKSFVSKGRSTKVKRGVKSVKQNKRKTKSVSKH